MPLAGIFPGNATALGTVAPRLPMEHPVGVYAYPGHPFFALVYSRAVPVAQTATLRASVPLTSASAEWAVSVTP
jgi:hypothetical protein